MGEHRVVAHREGHISLALLIHGGLGTGLVRFRHPGRRRPGGGGAYLVGHSPEPPSSLPVVAPAAPRERSNRQAHKPARGGDYMRMWTRVLVEDDTGNQGQRFNGYYFIGPNDVRSFFSNLGPDLSTAVENYFATKLSVDSIFAARFQTGDPLKDSEMKQSFFRYYLTKGGALYSRGSHDEWNIWVLLNQLRLSGTAGIAELLAGYYDGQPISIDSCDHLGSWGYGKLD